MISFGPEHAPLEQKQVEMALEETRKLVPPPQLISAQAAEARRKFGIHNRGQAHGWNFGKAAEPKPEQTPKGGALAEAAMSQLKARLFRSSQPFFTPDAKN